jgi:magnesium chelatase subunit D
MTNVRPPQELRASDAMLACALVAIDPHGFGGAILRGPGGPAQEAWLRQLRRWRPEGTPFRKLPSHAREDRLLGGLDVAATLNSGRPVVERGLLAEADVGILVLASAERFESGLAALVAAALDQGEVAVERNGVASRLAARFGLIALDESVNEDERIPAVLDERLAFIVHPQEDLEDQALDPPGNNVDLSRVGVPAVIAESLCQTAMALGIGSVRPVMFAVRAARGIAALDDRHEVSEDDAMTAARLVLAPRATVFPVEEQQEDEQSEPPPPESDAPSSEEQSQPTAEELSEILLEAVKPALPPGLLEAAALGQRMRGSSRMGRGGQARKAKGTQGRKVGTRPGTLGHGARLNILETLRAAAPMQKLRAVLGSGHSGIRVRREDFRINRYKKRQESTAIFAVDASGSAALHRLAEAKGAVELILADCYVRRDKVALVAFRGRKAEVLLPPTRSLQRARRCLADLPGGGGTPLSLGIDASLAVAEQVVRGGGSPLLVFLTDGRANVAGDGTTERAAAMRDALASSRAMQLTGHPALLIDVSPQPGEAARQIAAAMGARYLPLPNADATRISRSVAQAMKPGALAA